MSEDFDRRITRLERREEAQSEALQELLVSSRHVNEVLVEMREALPRLRTLEHQIATISTVMSIIKWVSATVGATAIAMVLAFVFGTQSVGGS